MQRWKFLSRIIADFCQRNHITKLALFVSVLRDDFGPESDAEVLVQFDPEQIPGLAFFGMQDELGTIFHREVDLLTFAGISKYYRKKILRETQTVYVGPQLIEELDQLDLPLEAE